MFASLFLWQKRHRKKRSDSQREDIPLSQSGMRPPSQDKIVNNGDQRRTYWHLALCYSLHAFLVVLHLILLGIAVSHHTERRVVVQHHIELFTTGLSGGLQAFYTLYTALLVFVTQRLMLSSIFSRPKKLTEIHDICGAWAGLGASLNALWQQTKVASSVLSVSLVAVYFVCVSVLHITSTTLIRLQLFNDTTTSMGPVLVTWPNASINLTSFDWGTVIALVPFLQGFYGNTTKGLANNTLYDVPQTDFINATVHATTVNANCGLLTNLSISNTTGWIVNVSMPALGPISAEIWATPSLNMILSSPNVMCHQPTCSALILFLVTAEMEVGDSLGVNYIYINPDNFNQSSAPPEYFVACSLNATNHMVTLDSSGIQLDSGVQPTDVVWSAFSPGGDLNLISGISNAVESANEMSSAYCPQTPWEAFSVFEVYMGSILGMSPFLCGQATPEQYPNTSLPLAKYQFEGAISQFAAEFLWLAGELGSVGGGFDRQTEEATIVSTMPQWKLNINILPVTIALCASVILFVLVVCSLQRHQQGVMSSAGVLEMMWFGSRSQVLRHHLSDVRTPSLDRLRESSMFDTVFWTQSMKGNDDFCTPVPLRNPDDRASSSRPRSLLGSGASVDVIPPIVVEATATLRLSNDVSLEHRSNTSYTRRWCYALHILFVALHVILLALLVHHPEQSVIIPSKTSAFTVGLSALLQGVYTLYTAVLVLLMQRLASFKIVSERRKLTTVHDVSGAWTGVGAATNILQQQRKTSSSIWEVVGVGTYLMLMLVLHIISSSIMQWAAFIPTTTGVVQTYLALPNSSVDLSQVIWSNIIPIAGWIGATNLATPGLWHTTLYDIPQNPNDPTFTFVTVNATTLTAQCGLVSNLTLSVQNGSYQISFQSGPNNAGFFEVDPIGTDSIYEIYPLLQSTGCVACPQTLFFMITTNVNVDQSVQDPIFVGLNSTIMLSPVEFTSPIIPTYVAACSVNAQTTSVQLNISADVLETAPNTTTVPTSSSWSLWSPGNATNGTNLIDEVVTILNEDEGQPLVDDITSLLGLNLSFVAPSTAAPSVTLSPWQLENAVAQTSANCLWLAGQVGEDGGGFQRPVGESPAIGSTMKFRLHLDAVPVFVASMAAFLSLILAMFIIGKPSEERDVSISGTSVLECLWLEAHSESIHAHMEMVEGPDLDRLRAEGMFDICLGDIGRASNPETEQPMLVLADE